MRRAWSAVGAFLALGGLPAGAQRAAGPFRDVPRGHWAYQSIENLRQKGILLGYPDHSKPRPKSGIEGVAEVGPVRPVDRPGEKNSRPLVGAAISLLTAEGGKQIARAKTDTSGRFRFTVGAGKYRLVPMPPRPGSRYPAAAQPQEVVVKAGEVAHVTLQYDSGIR